MKEKEERIFIRKGTARELCKFIYRDGCAGEMHCCSCAISIPRSEVIDKMAKAFYAENVVRCNSDDCPPGSETCDGCPIWENCKHLAKIALNALLEEQK